MVQQQHKYHMHRPQHHIELKTREPLPKGQAGAWYRTVRDHGPNGITAATDMRIGRELVNSKLYAVRGRTGMHYVVPLSRDLTGREAAAIARAWDAAAPDGDFALHWSQEPEQHPRSEQLQQDLLAQIAETAAKHYHNRWHQQMMEQGWRFGHRLSQRHRQHPMLQSWEGLSEKYKSTERERFHTLLGVLEGLDLAITQR
jgi:RyR domain